MPARKAPILLPPAAEPHPGYVVLRDSREKPGQGWTFAVSAACGGTRAATLQTGDYTLVGYEHLLCVERKGSLTEFAKNVCEARFRRELERMAPFKHAVVILEFDMSDVMRWPEGSGIPRSRLSRLRVTKSVILAKFWELQRDFPTVSFIFAGSHGKEVVSSLFKRVVEKYARH